MSYEVDVGGLGLSIGPPTDPPITFGLVWPGEIAPHQWYRLSIAIDPGSRPDLPADPPIYTNPPGTLLTVISEQYGVQDDGQQFTQLTVRNDSVYDVPRGSQVTVTFTVNAISSPSHQ